MTVGVESFASTTIVFRLYSPHESVAAGGSGLPSDPVAAVGTFNPPARVPSHAPIVTER